jgi:hypothetical protein
MAIVVSAANYEDIVLTLLIKSPTRQPDYFLSTGLVYIDALALYI